jgi:branched-chain amino acid transport system substrate-binding protein
VSRIAVRNLSFVLLISLLLMIFPSVGIGQPALKMGALIPFSGRWGDSGRECAKGMLDGAKWLNQRGGVFGRKLEIVLIDDTSQTAETMAAYRKLNEADHIPLLYLYSTETAVSLSPHIHLDRIPTLVSSLPSRLADPSRYPYLFTITPTSLDLLRIGIKFISEKPGTKARNPRIVFVGSLKDAGLSFWDEIKSYARASGLDIGPDTWIPEIPLPMGESDSQGKTPLPLLSVMDAYDPDVSFLNLTSKEAAFVLTEGRKMGLKTKWVCSRKAFDENLSGFAGIFGVQPIPPFGEDVPGMAAVKEAHQKWHPYDSHTLSYVEGWATVQAAAEVLGRSLPEARLSRERVKNSFESLKDFVLGGLVPPLTITSSDHRPSVESRIFTTKAGKISRHTGFVSLGR